MSNYILPKAICIIKNKDKILVSEYYNPIKKEYFYRPLGGRIEFGEHSEAAIIRELHEELDAKVINLKLLTVIENIYYYKEKWSHEIMFVYEGEFEDASLYKFEEIIGFEKTSNRFIKALWKSIHDFETGADTLYPKGLLELLQEQPFIPHQKYYEKEIFSYSPVKVQ